jgi:hypothetical protein
MSTEYETAASLWNTFHSLVQQDDDTVDEGEGAEGAGVPGTGGYVISSQTKGNESDK